MIEEKEIKIILSYEEYLEVNKLFEWENDYVQTNYYYADDKDIKGNRSTYKV